MGFMSIVQQIIGGFGTTLFIFFFTLLFSLPLGILFALARMSKFKPLNWFMQVCISILRGTPLMLQLIVVFFMPFYVFGIKLSAGWRVYAALIGFPSTMRPISERFSGPASRAFPSASTRRRKCSDLPGRRLSGKSFSRRWSSVSSRL